MNRRGFLGRFTLCSLSLATPWAGWLNAQDSSRVPTSPKPIPEPHFPDRFHLFVWRNWELVNTERLAQVLETTTEKILEIGTSMGLPKKIELSENQLRRIYITVIRQNWHILSEEQLIELLGWTREHYEYVLKEDDFLWIKLGSVKPHCERLRYESPSLDVRQRAAEIKKIVRTSFGPSLDEAGEPAFTFVGDLSAV